MTPADRATESRRQQGLPERVTDPAVLARIAALLIPRPQETRQPARGAA